MSFRLAIVSTHPIQYYAPLFKLLAGVENLLLKVFYTQGDDQDITDEGFRKKITWDIPLLEGYEFEFLKNTSNEKGNHHFKGIVNPNIINRIDSFKPDAILVYGWAYQSHLKILGHYAGKISLWFRGDSTLLDKQGLFKAVIKNLYLRRIYKHIEHAFYVGTNNRAYFKHYGLKDEQLTFAPHAVNNKHFEADKTAEAIAIRLNLGISTESILILFAGKFEEKKDPLLLLRAFLKLQNKNIHLLFVGNGQLEENMKILAKTCPDRASYIHFMDFQNQTQMPAIYQACDLFCLPSKGPAETWGLAVNEAMAAGKAILVSNKVGCAIDLVEDQKNGFIFESGNINELIGKLDFLAQSRMALAAMGKYSNSIIKHWTLEKQAEIFINHINLAEKKL